MSVEFKMTEWFEKAINPVHNGVYEVKTLSWPFPFKGEWNGKQWHTVNVDTGLYEIENPYVSHWRGLADDPSLTEGEPTIVEYTKWKIEPTWKKSVIERQTWIKPDVAGYITHEIGWRWGEFFIETEGDTPPDLHEGVDMFCCGYDCDDWSTDDGCWEETDIDVADEEEKAKIEEFLEENSIFDLEELGWVNDDTEMIINCELSIEKVE